MVGKDEVTLAKQVLQFSFMVNSGFRFLFAHWPTGKTPPGSLYFTFWKAVKWLNLNGFEVFYCCLDGSETNRSFIKLHFKNKDSIEEKFTVVNPYNRKPFVFFVDPEVKYQKVDTASFKLRIVKVFWYFKL